MVRRLQKVSHPLSKNESSFWIERCFGSISTCRIACRLNFQARLPIAIDCLASDPKASFRTFLRLSARSVLKVGSCPRRATSMKSDGPDGNLAFRAAKLSGVLNDFPAFRPVAVKDGREPPYYRHVRFKIRTAAIASPDIDFEQGPLVRSDQLPELVSDLFAEARRRDYPARAMREEREGTGIVECQVQADLSIACHMLSFEPATKSADFFAEPKRYLAGKFAKPKLQNGEDARGVRTRVTIKWTISR